MQQYKIHSFNDFFFGFNFQWPEKSFRCYILTKMQHIKLPAMCLPRQRPTELNLVPVFNGVCVCECVHMHAHTWVYFQSFLQ